MTKDILLLINRLKQELDILEYNTITMPSIPIRKLKMPQYFVGIRKIKQQEITAHTSILLAFAQSSGLTPVAINSRLVKYISYDT